MMENIKIIGFNNAFIHIIGGQIAIISIVMLFSCKPSIEHSYLKQVSSSNWCFKIAFKAPRSLSYHLCQMSEKNIGFLVTNKQNQLVERVMLDGDIDQGHGYINLLIPDKIRLFIRQNPDNPHLSLNQAAHEALQINPGIKLEKTWIDVLALHLDRACSFCQGQGLLMRLPSDTYLSNPINDQLGPEEASYQWIANRKRSMTLLTKDLPTKNIMNQFDSSDCAIEPLMLPMNWPTCSPHVPCKTHNSNWSAAVYLMTPVIGAVAQEAHLVTQEEDFSGMWPAKNQENISQHYIYSQVLTGVDYTLVQPWAPAEGGSKIGQSATTRKLPAIAEIWYITMHWKVRPPQGTRMIVFNPANGKSVVAAGGYETGPGSASFVAGVSEEIMAYLQVKHQSPLFVGFAKKQQLPLGPIGCFSD